MKDRYASYLVGIMAIICGCVCAVSMMMMINIPRIAMALEKIAEILK